MEGANTQLPRPKDWVIIIANTVDFIGSWAVRSFGWHQCTHAGDDCSLKLDLFSILYASGMLHACIWAVGIYLLVLPAALSYLQVTSGNYSSLLWL